MQNRSSAAERMRPFIQAMERSIDEARRDRTHADQPSEQENPHYATDPARPYAHDEESGDPKGADNYSDAPIDPTRMKAKPKRRF